MTKERKIGSAVLGNLNLKKGQRIAILDSKSSADGEDKDFDIGIVMVG